MKEPTRHKLEEINYNKTLQFMLNQLLQLRCCSQFKTPSSIHPHTHHSCCQLPACVSFRCLIVPLVHRLKEHIPAQPRKTREGVFTPPPTPTVNTLALKAQQSLNCTSATTTTDDDDVFIARLVLMSWHWCSWLLSGGDTV